MGELKRITELTIERSKWLRGCPERTRLLDGAGCMCCLGFACVAAGLHAADIVERGTPAELGPGALVPLLSVDHRDGDFYPQNTDFSIAAMAANDDPAIDGTEREARLTKLFAAEGIALRFVP